MKSYRTLVTAGMQRLTSRWTTTAPVLSVKHLVQCAAFSLALALFGVATAARAGVAVYTTGTIELLAAPPALGVETGVTESDTFIRLFAEKTGWTLATDLAVDVISPGTYDDSTPTTPGVIPAGTVVNSYFLHLDRVGATGAEITLSGSITFDEKIIGVIFSDANLDASDPILGNSTYSTGQINRGLGANVGIESDIVAWNCAMTITVQLPISSVTDQVRIITTTPGQRFDYGDAPDSYHTTLATDGARHTVRNQLYLGAFADEEADGSPSAAADCDDSTSIYPGLDDETGLVSSPVLIPDTTVTFELSAGITNGFPAYIDAWVDLNYDGEFNHPDEQVITSGLVPNTGTHSFSYPVPSWVAPGFTYARFRLSSTGGLLPTGYFSNGEVEDYLFTIAAAIKPVGYFPFPFPPGANLAGQTETNGIVWATAGPAGPQITVAPNSLAVPGLVPPAGNRTRLAGVNGPAARIGLGTNVTTGTLYYSLALHVASLGTLGPNGGTLAAFNNATGTSVNLPAPLAARLLVRSTTGGYQLGLSKSSTNGNDFVWATTTLDTNETAFVVLAYEFKAGADDLASLWLNPPPASFGGPSAPPATLTSTNGADIPEVQSFVLMQRPQPVLPEITFVDEVRVGTSWASVAPPAPPDLAVTLKVLPGTVVSTSNLVYSISVTNGGAGAASGIVLSNPMPVGITFVSVTSSQGSCSNSPSGVQCSLGTLQPGGAATVNVVGIPDFDQLATALNIPEMQETISMSNTVSVVAAEADASPLNNRATAFIMVLPQRDFGDAPAPPYPTLLPSAARHKISPLRFGVSLDAEPNGLPVDMDDLTGVDDEIPDGFGLAAGYYAGGWTPITIQVNGPAGYIDMWFDTDGVPGWGAADQVLTAVAHPGGGAAVGYMIALPPGAVVGPAWARARVHLNPAGLPTTGYGGRGEVVDFQVNILPAAVDLLAVANPAQLTLTEGDLLTQTITVSNKGPSTATAARLEVHFPPGATLENLQLSQGVGQMEGTNLVCNLGTLAPKASALVTFTAGTSNIFAGRAEEFMDFGDWWWLTANETELKPDDNAPLGIVRVIRRLDFPDAPGSYGTLRIDNAARHGGDTNCLLILGSHIDRERDGHPSADALGDDNHQSPDDEDGIVFLDALVPGAVARVQVTVNIIPAACWNCAVLNAWVDLNRNGVFDLASDRIVQDLCLPSGTHVLSFTVPAGASNGVSYARFRLTSTTGTTPLGYKPDGEVEDYRVTVGEAIGTRRWIALDGQAAPGAPVNVEVLQATATQTRVRLTVPGVWQVTDWYAGQRFYHLEFVPGEFKGVGFPEAQGARSWYDFPADSGQALLPGQRYRRAFNIAPVQANFPESALGSRPRTAAEMEALGIDPAGARPAIPALRALLAVSRQTTANDLGMQTLNRQFHDLHLNAALTPAGFEGLDQPAPDVSEGYTPPQLVDETFYGGFTGEYAGTEATFSAVSGMGAFAGVQVRVPLMQAVSPQDVKVVASMEIQFDHRVAVVDLACPPQYDVWSYKMPYVNGAAIVDGLTARGLVVSAVRAARYLIITPRDWADSFTDFASWKASKGLNVDYAYVGETVASDRASIDAYIESYYATHWCRGVYVLLAGDVDVIESGRSAYTDIDTDAESDHVYEVIGGDTVASVYVGRLSANTEEELQTQLAKILSYERDPVPGDWPYYITLAANSQNDDESYGVSASFPSKYAACINEIAAYDYNPYLSGSFQVLHAGAASEADPRAVNQDVIDAINAGRGQVLYRGHGSSISWGSGWDGSSERGASWTASTHVPQLNNTAYPIVYGIACQNNHIDSSDSLGETFMSRDGGGAVAYFGASLNSYTSENHERAKGIFKAQWDSGIRTLGPMLAEAERFSSLTSVESKWLNNTFGYLLLGDPEMSVKPPATILDMSLYVDASNLELFEGAPHVFSVTVSNRAAFTATGVELRATLPSELIVQSITSSQGSCSVLGREVVCALASLDAQRSATVQVTMGAIFATWPTQEFIDLESFSWAVSAAGTDRHPDDNQARTTVRLRRKLDYPDAPVSYGTLRVDNAARHGGGTNCLLLLGANIDREPDGQPSPLADGDDIHGGPDDGDGITFLDPLIPGSMVRVRVVVNIIPATCWNCAVLNAWVDFNGNGAFDLASDRIIHDQCLPAGTHVLTFTVPANAANGASYARFRLTGATGVTPLGFQPDGEVEDYPVTIAFPPIVAFNGLQHEALGNATLSISPNGVQIANLGTNGTDGVRINLGRAEGWRAAVARQPVQASGIVYSVNIVGLTAGISNQSLATLRMERAGSNLMCSADFSGIGASQYVAEYYDQSGVLLSSTPPMAARQSITILGCVCHIEVLADSIYILVCDCDFDIPGGGLLGGSPGGVLVKLSAVAPTARPDFVSAVEITGTGSLTLGSEAFRQFGLWHRFLGEAVSGGSLTTGAEPWNLRVGAIGSSGEDGIETIVGGPEFIGELPAGNLLRQRVVQAWPDDWEMPWLTSSNSQVRWKATGRVQGSSNSFENLSDVIVYPFPLPGFNGEQGTMLSARFDTLGVTQVQVEVFNGPAFVGSFTTPVGLVGSVSSTSQVSRVSVQVVNGRLVWSLNWDTRSAFIPPAGASLMGDRLRIIPLNPTTIVEGLRSLITRGANVESFAFRGFNSAAPQQPRLSAPRFIPGGGITLPIATEADVTYQIEASSSVNGPWTPIGQVMGTDGVSETEFEDTVPHISNSIRLFRIRIQ